MGKKYIAELPDCYILNRLHENKFLQVPIVLENGDDAVIRTVIPLTPYTEPDLEQVRKEAYDKGYDDATAEIGSDEQAIAEKAYQKGLSDAWDAAKKIALDKEDGGLDTVAYCETFGYGKGFGAVLKTFTASEAIEKIRKYEQEKEEQIRVGDEVIPKETEYDTMIVTRLWKDDYDSDCIDAIGFDGRISSFLVSRVSKTGKHYEIAEVLAKMKESDNG